MLALTRKLAQHANLLVAGLLCLAGAGILPTARAANVPEPEIPQVKMINAAFAQQWKDYGLTPAPVEEDAKWCRRV